VNYLSAHPDVNLTHLTAHNSLDTPFLALLDDFLLKLLHLARAFLLDRLLLRALSLLLVRSCATEKSAKLESRSQESNDGRKVDVITELLEDELGSGVQSAVASKLPLREPPTALGASASSVGFVQTYDCPGNATADDESVCAQYPNIVLAFNHPLRDGNLVFTLLGSIGVSVLGEVLSNSLISQTETSAPARKPRRLTPYKPW
jgi:hypothetical protein